MQRTAGTFASAGLVLYLVCLIQKLKKAEFTLKQRSIL
jgi:hypothetical protein